MSERVAAACSSENALVAPVLTPSQAGRLMCPLLSHMGTDGAVHRVSCQIGACTLWDWLIQPSRIPMNDFQGVGTCSIPRRAYACLESVTATRR
jgi:hypothetical protein